MASSRDFGFTTLRSIQAYRSDGSRVPPNNVLTTGITGEASFSNTLTISTINTSTTSTNFISANIISSNIVCANIIDVNVLSTNVHYTSTISTTSIYTSYLQSDSTLLNGPLTVNGIVGINGDLIVSNNISSNNISSNNISSNIVTSSYLSTFSTINLMNGLGAPLELTWNTSTLFIDGHPVSTDGTISSVSTIFWDDLPGGSIFNKNVGTGDTKYLVGIGTYSSPLNATLDVKYAGGSNYGNVLNVSTGNGKQLTFDNNGVLSTDILKLSTILNVQNISTASIYDPSTSYFIDYTRQFSTTIQPYPVLRFNSQEPGSSSSVIENKSLTLTMGNGVATWSSQWEGYIMQDMQFLCQNFNVSSTQNIILESQSSVNIQSLNTVVSNNLYVSSLLTNNINMNNGLIRGLSTITTDNSLNISSSTDGAANIILFNGKGKITTNPAYDGVYIEASNNRPIYLGNINNVSTYASFGPISTIINGNLTVGNGNTSGGTVLSVNGSAGVSRVFDAVYNPPPVSSSAVVLFGSFMGTLANSQSTTFSITETGMYMIQTIYNVGSGVAPTGGITGALLFGNPANASQFVEGSMNTVQAAALPTNSTVQTQVFINLSSTTYEPNQHYKFIISGSPSSGTGGTGGTVQVQLYKLF